MSHPVWVRGLKPCLPVRSDIRQNVAPRVGAWIETPAALLLHTFIRVAPRVGAWIETNSNRHKYPRETVAPRVGAWIETACKTEQPYRLLSHPVWVRGLKQEAVPLGLLFAKSHPVWVRGLKHGRYWDSCLVNWSHPVWVRGLKQGSESKSICL